MLADITPKPELYGYWLIFSRDKILLDTREQGLALLSWAQLPFIHHYAERVSQLRADDLTLEHPLFVVDLGSENISAGYWQAEKLRYVMRLTEPTLFAAIARAWQYTHFARTHRFCGQCGYKTEPVSWEMAVQCHSCGHRCYPRVSPCIIVAIYRPNQILLAKGIRHKDSDMYSTIAGFVESGESLEQALHREVLEEVGVKVKNLDYFGSQPWPFPHSLMVGYLAEYESGDIVVQEDEIVDAYWFDLDNLPTLPSKLSIAGRLIEEVVKRHNKQNEQPTEGLATDD
jgi:NAD+ diphosphatase